MAEFGLTIMLDIWSILLLLGALHGFFLAAIFFKKGWRKNTSNNLFATFLAAISYIVTIQFLHEARVMVYTPHLLATSTPVLYLLGPVFYLYVHSLLDREFGFRWKQLIHFAPFVVCILTIIPFYAQSTAFKVDYIQQSTSGPVNLPYTRAIYYGVALLQNGIYWWLCYRITESVRGNVRSFIQRWLTRSITVYGWFLVGYLVILCLFLFTDFYLREVRYTGYLILSVSVHLYGYLLLQESLPVEKPQTAEKYSDSKLNKKEIVTIRQKLLNQVEGKKLYLNGDLKLEDVAEEIHVTPHQLSQVINVEFNSNFNEFINSFRVKEAQILLTSEGYDAYSLEGIAMESGFNNRTSFYRVFKKHTGTTPAQFKKEHS